MGLSAVDSTAACPPVLQLHITLIQTLGKKCACGISDPSFRFNISGKLKELQETRPSYLYSQLRGVTLQIPRSETKSMFFLNLAARKENQENL